MPPTPSFMLSPSPPCTLERWRGRRAPAHRGRCRTLPRPGPGSSASSIRPAPSTCSRPSPSRSADECQANCGRGSGGTWMRRQSWFFGTCRPASVRSSSAGLDSSLRNKGSFRPLRLRLWSWHAPACLARAILRLLSCNRCDARHLDRRWQDFPLPPMLSSKMVLVPSAVS
jgi:hypothetical protein